MRKFCILWFACFILLPGWRALRGETILLEKFESSPWILHFRKARGAYVHALLNDLYPKGTDGSYLSVVFSGLEGEGFRIFPPQSLPALKIREIHIDARGSLRGHSLYVDLLLNETFHRLLLGKTGETDWHTCSLLLPEPQTSRILGLYILPHKTTENVSFISLDNLRVFSEK